MEIRLETKQDIPSIFDLNSSAFKTAAEAQLIDNLRNANDLSLSLVATMNDSIVGHIAYSPMHLPRFEELKLVGLGPMAAHPKHQKQGIGSKLIQDSLQLLTSRGTDAVFLLGHPEYYPRFGFAPALSTFNIKSVYDVPDNVFMGLELKPDALNTATGTVEYASAFANLS